MSARRILTLFFGVFVLAEARWHSKREAISICNPMSGNRSQIMCFCIKDSRQSIDYIKSADCFLTTEGVEVTSHAWDTLQQLKTTLKITLTNSRGINLRYIPTNGLKHLENLVQINVQYGNIEKIHRFAFANLSNVEEISLRDNQIKNLEKHSFAHHRSLTEIKMDKNNILEINRDVFIDLPSLGKLCLTDNRITTIHDRAFMHLGNLKELEIYKNKIFSLNSETFSGLNKLERLDLSSNSLEVIGDNTFYPLINLMSLNLDNNKIQMIDNRAFNNLAKLQILSLAHNKLSNINDEVFVGLDSLISLSLRGNEIKDLNFKAVDPLLQNLYESRSHLDIEDNILSCDCKLDWFLRLMNNTQSKVLKIAMENLKCLPDATLRDQWNRMEERNSAETIDMDGTGPPGVEYEYYDDSQLNGMLFYIDIRDIIGCDKNNSDTPEGVTTQKNGIIVTAAKETKVTTSIPVTPRLSMTETNTTTFEATKKHFALSKSIIQTNTAEPHKNHGILDLAVMETTTMSKDEEEEETDENIPDSYTTSRLVNVSAKPMNVYENMAADEAKPDKLNAQRSHQAEFKDFKTGKAYNHGGCVALILLTCAGLLFH